MARAKFRAKAECEACSVSAAKFDLRSHPNEEVLSPQAQVAVCRCSFAFDYGKHDAHDAGKELQEVDRFLLLVLLWDFPALGEASV